MANRTISRGPYGFVLIVLAACDGSEPIAPHESDSSSLSVARGETAFLDECAHCHAARDGFDLAFFRFSDTTIVRRAVAHVTEPTALDIVDYIRSLDTPLSSRHVRPFQPGYTLLSSDRQFAIELFGMDGIPSDWDAKTLVGIDPLAVAAAVRLPEWSIEESNLDWMPDQQLPESILDDRGSLVRRRLAGYYAAPTIENLSSAVTALRRADRSRDSAGAPCVFDAPTQVDHQACFEIRRWTATLVAQHMLRRGMTEPIHSVLHNTWWDVGNAARKARQSDVHLENDKMNWASWMYLGWIFDPGRHASIYTGSGLSRVGLPRHATFVALKSLVSRREGSMAVWPDARSAAQFAPDGWAFSATRIAYVHLLDRLATGEKPEGAEALEEARSFVDRAFGRAARKVTADERVELGELRDEIVLQLQ